MKCPVDSIDLIMTERSGVEIDYCPQCRGVWLDRGELDKILDRAADSFGPAPAAPPPPLPPAPGTLPPPIYNFDQRGGDRPNRSRQDQPRYDDRGHDRGYDRSYDRDYDRRRPKKKEGWLGDLFDF
jgi:Zn-finger nucleic acid-binding protein